MNEREKRKIAIDKDDVLIDFNGQLCRFHNEKYGTNLRVEDIYAFELHRVWDCTPSESMKRLMDFYETTYFHSITAMDGALEAVTELKDDNDLYIVTARPAEIVEETLQSVHRLYPDIFSGVHFAHSSGSGNRRSKAEVCLELGIKTIIDDSLHNIRGCRDAGIESYLFRRPWNDSVSDEMLLAEHITPVKNWAEVLTQLKGAKNDE